MRDYVCDRCGAILDPGERCECRDLRVVVLHANGEIEMRLTDGSLKALQEIVGGPIEHLRAFVNIGLLVNEEGRLRGLPPNPFFPRLVGNVILIGEPTGGKGEFRALSEPEVGSLIELFAKGEKHA